jgi:hypothetical protein
MLAPPDPKMRRTATLPGSGPKFAKEVQQQHQGIKLPPILQALREEIRTLDRYLRCGWITPEEAAERLNDWGIAYPPGMVDIEELADRRRWGAA